MLADDFAMTLMSGLVEEIKRTIGSASACQAPDLSGALVRSGRFK